MASQLLIPAIQLTDLPKEVVLAQGPKAEQELRKLGESYSTLGRKLFTALWWSNIKFLCKKTAADTGFLLEQQLVEQPAIVEAPTTLFSW